jgi:hypothetical protein
MKRLIEMIKQSEKDWDTLPHWTCPRCKTEILKRDKKDHQTHTFLCDEILKRSR